ncbi:hypothetical protein NP233_g397 [Leucocoprinus birnbaumii]|uniref:Serine hydrolase FSH domain-containing protein n=1 Tax=Leucocoprinus birnbaumii TaxID=56174 RepID=A0AAD5YYN8_9AGAR|nr:hypothetical protein NP233_g397 [Leucocoprinus birnbaumii]
MAPLPQVTPTLESELMNDPCIISAYNVCLKQEGELTTDNEIRHIRVLGCLLRFAPKRNIGVYLAKSILSCQDEPEILVKLGQYFELHVIVPFKKYRVRTPATSSPPSRRSLEDHWRQVKAKVAQAPKNHKDAKDQALVRDNWTCAATGLVHFDAPTDSFTDPPPTEGAYLDCAHIIPEDTFLDVNEKDGGNPKLDYAATILAFLEPFGYDINSFNGEKVHSLVNVITMDKNTHELFDRLQLYFEATSTKNRYQIKYYTSLKPFLTSDFVRFSSSDPVHLPVPSPELLALHATCCKVAQMSGASEHIDKVYDELDKTGVLAYDGTSGDILSYKLLSLTGSSTCLNGRKTLRIGPPWVTLPPQPQDTIYVTLRSSFSQNANIFSKRLGALRKEAKDIDLVFVDAPHVLQPVDLIGAHARNPALSFDAPEADLQAAEQDPLLTPRAWWRPNPERTKGVGLVESLVVIRDVLKTRTFEGVMGFSQGAAFAAVIAALLEKPESYPPFLIDGKPPHPPMKFCIAVSGFKLTDPICDPLFDPFYSTPTLHVIGKNDIVVIEERSRKLIAVSKNKRVEEHEGGHFVPSKGNWRKFLAEYLRNPSGDILSPGMSSASAPPSGTVTPTVAPDSGGGSAANMLAQKL